MHNRRQYRTEMAHESLTLTVRCNQCNQKSTYILGEPVSREPFSTRWKKIFTSKWRKEKDLENHDKIWSHIETILDNKAHPDER